MKQKKLFHTLFLTTLITSVLFTSCQKDLPEPTPPQPQPEASLLVLNEGHNGITFASVNRYQNKQWTLKLFQAANSGKKLGDVGVSITRHGNSFYIVSKDHCFLSQANKSDWKETARIGMPQGGKNPLGDGAQARNFCIVDDKTGVLTATSGAFAVALQPLTLGKPLGGIDNSAGATCEDVCRAGDYLFLINKTNDSKRIMAYKATDLSFVKELGEALTGFVQSGETLWAAGEKEMIKINTKNLAADRLPLSNDIEIYTNKWAYTHTSLRLSQSGNSIYFVKKTTREGSVYGKEIWQFDTASKKTSLLYKPTAGNISVYGSALAVHPTSGDIYALYTEDGSGGAHYLNTAIHVIDAKTGGQKEIIPYTKTGETEYWFPAMLLFDQQ